MPLSFEEWWKGAYSVTPVCPSIHPSPSTSSIGNFFRWVHPCPLDTFLVYFSMPLSFEEWWKGAYSVTPVCPSIHPSPSTSSIGNFFRWVHPCPLDTFLVYFFMPLSFEEWWKGAYSVTPVCLSICSSLSTFTVSILYLSSSGGGIHVFWTHF